MAEVMLEGFLDGVDQIEMEAPGYRLGHDGSDGECDCIGLIIGAIRRSGGSWAGIHGTNYAARNEVAYLLPVAEEDDLAVGEVVFKARMPGQGGYSLPDRYSTDPDRRDYYHVGVVRSVAPLRIVHCTSPGGVVTDGKLGKWTYRAWVRKVKMEVNGGDAQMQDVQVAMVVAETGSNVNLRKTPGGALVDRVPVGATVVVTAKQDGWVRVSYGDQSGWMMEQFVQQDGETAAAAPSADCVSITLLRSVAEQLRDALSGAMGWE